MSTATHERVTYTVPERVPSDWTGPQRDIHFGACTCGWRSDTGRLDWTQAADRFSEHLSDVLSGANRG